MILYQPKAPWADCACYGYHAAAVVDGLLVQLPRLRNADGGVIDALHDALRAFFQQFFDVRTTAAAAVQNLSVCGKRQKPHSPPCQRPMAQIHHSNHDLPAEAHRLAGILKKRHFSASLTFFHHNNLVGDIPHGGQLVQHLINRDKHRHALGQTVFRSQPEVWQQRGQSRTVLEGVIAQLNLDMTYKEMLNKVSVETSSDSRIVSISVTDEDPYTASEIANAVRDMAAEHIQSVMDIEAVNVVDTANIPNEKASPSLAKNGVIGGLLGVIIAMAAVIIIYLTNDTIKVEEDVERYLGLSVLGSIPFSEKESRSKKKKSRKRR